MRSILIRYRLTNLKSDAGYALAMSALLLLPLLAFSGLAVDVGSWYARGAELQRAADAAALAGAGSLPRGVGQAQNVALEVAAQNGFTNGVNGISIEAVYVDPDQMKVTITDDEVPQYLTGFIRSAVSVQRHSTAEYVPPVKMGSPRNFLGTGNKVFAPYGAENFWLAVSSPCASKENGDRIQTERNANFSTTVSNIDPWQLGGTSWLGCRSGSSVVNTEYSPDGYFYAIRLEKDYTGTIAIQIYDADICSGSKYPDGTFGTRANSDARFTTTFQMRDNSSGNPTLTNKIGTPLRLNGSNCGTYREKWVNLHTLNNPSRGTYYVQVTSSNPASTNVAGASNAFGLRANYTSTGDSFQACTTESSGDSGYRENCPNVFAVENLGVSANIAGSEPSWYLADIGPEHSGKTMVVQLWDPGEGSVALELINPMNQAVDFKWTVVKSPGDTDPTGGVGPGVTNKLDLLGNTMTLCRSDNTYQRPNNSGNCARGYSKVEVEHNPQPGPGRLSAAKYNDRLLILEVDLPEDIDAAFGGRTWWRIRYHSGDDSPSDRTTWSVTIKGDPVRIVE